jgi:hypothetical protein
MRFEGSPLLFVCLYMCCAFSVLRTCEFERVNEKRAGREGGTFSTRKLEREELANSFSG